MSHMMRMISYDDDDVSVFSYMIQHAHPVVVPGAAAVLVLCCPDSESLSFDCHPINCAVNNSGSPPSTTRRTEHGQHEI